MTTSIKLATAALAGLYTAGMLVASPALASDHEKSACKGASGCKGKAAAEKTNCKTTQSKEKHACNATEASKDEPEAK